MLYARICSVIGSDQQPDRRPSVSTASHHDRPLATHFGSPHGLKFDGDNRELAAVCVLPYTWTQTEVACTYLYSEELLLPRSGRLIISAYTSTSFDGAASKDPDSASLRSGSLLLVLVIATGSPHEQSEVSKAHGEEE